MYSHLDNKEHLKCELQEILKLRVRTIYRNPEYLYFYDDDGNNNNNNKMVCNIYEKNVEETCSLCVIHVTCKQQDCSFARQVAITQRSHQRFRD
jgi:hypothetical protein